MNLFKKGGNKYNNTGRGVTRMASLEMLSEQLVTFKKEAKSFFEKHKSSNLISGRKSHSRLAVITVSELLVV